MTGRTWPSLHICWVNGGQERTLTGGSLQSETAANRHHAMGLGCRLPTYPTPLARCLLTLLLLAAVAVGGGHIRAAGLGGAGIWAAAAAAWKTGQQAPGREAGQQDNPLELVN